MPMPGCESGGDMHCFSYLRRYSHGVVQKAVRISGMFMKTGKIEIEEKCEWLIAATPQRGMKNGRSHDNHTPAAADTPRADHGNYSF
jgi:hypothetical protein